MTIDFTYTKSDPCLYIYKMGRGVCFIDNLPRWYTNHWTGPDTILLRQLKEKLMARSSMADVVEVSLILAMKITRDRSKRTLRISQTDYTRSILDRFNMMACNPVSSPSSHRLSGVGKGILTAKIEDQQGIKHSVQLPVTSGSGLGRQLFSAGTAATKRVSVVITPILCLDLGNWLLRQYHIWTWGISR